MFLRAYGAKTNKEAENYLTIKSKPIQVNACFLHLILAHTTQSCFSPLIKKLFQEEHLARYGLIHLHLAPFYCKAEKILEQTAYTSGTAENT